jgi:hypothetical protein
LKLPQLLRGLLKLLLLLHRQGHRPHETAEAVETAEGLARGATARALHEASLTNT